MLILAATVLRDGKAIALALFVGIFAATGGSANAFEGIVVARQSSCRWEPMTAKAWNGAPLKARICLDTNGNIIELDVPRQSLDVSSRWVSRLFGFSGSQCKSSVDLDTVMPSMFCANKRATLVFSESGSPGLIAAWARKSFAR